MYLDKQKKIDSTDKRDVLATRYSLKLGIAVFTKFLLCLVFKTNLLAAISESIFDVNKCFAHILFVAGQ